MKLWLDDLRDPVNCGREGWTWVKTADEAIACLASGEVEAASLDHDLTQEQMVQGGFKGLIHDDGEKSGYDVVLWLEQHPERMPAGGVSIHTQNTAGRARMLEVLERMYV